MSAIYKSIVYDLTSFGIFSIKRALFSSDMDDGIVPSISFDGGGTFKNVELNRDFKVERSNGKVQVKLLFNSNSTSENTVKYVGYLENYVVGTTIYFKNISTKKYYKSILGENGKYVANLKPGKYDIYVEDINSIPVITNYTPTVRYVQNIDYKLNSVEELFKNISWAKYSICDIFDDEKKMSNVSTTIIDPYGNLSDGQTNAKVKYWVVCFDV